MKIKRLTAITLVLTILFCFSFVSVSAADYSVLDVSDIQKHIAGLIVLPDEKQKEYDFNNDGILSILDSTFLQRVLTDSESEEAWHAEPSHSRKDGRRRASDGTVYASWGSKQCKGYHDRALGNDGNQDR